MHELNVESDYFYFNNYYDFANDPSKSYIKPVSAGNLHVTIK